MKKYVCCVCSLVYDEAKGYPEEGIAPGTVWADIDSEWVCPVCGALKRDFVDQDVMDDPTLIKTKKG